MLNAPYEFAYRIRDLEAALKSCKTPPLPEDSVTAESLRHRLEQINAIADAALAEAVPAESDLL